MAADPLDTIARICAEQPHDALTLIAEALGFGQMEPSPVNYLRFHAQHLIAQYGSVRKAGDALGIDHSYLYRIAAGEKEWPLRKLTRTVASCRQPRRRSTKPRVPVASLSTIRPPASVAPTTRSSPMSEPIRHDVLYEYAQQHRLDYNNLCRVVRSAIGANPLSAAEAELEEMRLHGNADDATEAAAHLERLRHTSGVETGRGGER